MLNSVTFGRGCMFPEDTYSPALTKNIITVTPSKHAFCASSTECRVAVRRIRAVYLGRTCSFTSLGQAIRSHPTMALAAHLGAELNARNAA